VANPQQMKMLRQLQKMQADMAAAQEELAAARVEATAGGGVVSATVTGQGDLVEVRIDPAVVDPADVEMLQDLVVAAVGEATRNAKALQEQRMGAAAGGADLGGLGGLLG